VLDDDVAPRAAKGITRRSGLIFGAAGLATALSSCGDRAAAAPSSPTTVGMPYTVISEPTDLAVQEGIRAWREKFNGPFPLTRLLFGFSGTAELTTPLSAALGSTQIEGLRWEGLAKRSTVLRWSGDGPLLSAWGLLRNWLFSDFTVQSGRAGAQGFYLRSDSGRTNQDGGFDTIETMGAWDYFYGLDGQTSTANLNSEIFWRHCAMSNDANFASAWLWSGMTPEVSQQNQFLNYHLEDTKLEGSHGDYLRFDYGGHLSVDGYASFLHTGDANGGVPAGRMIYLPRGANGNSVMKLNLDNVRAELRPNAEGSTDSVFLDSAWSDRGAINLTGVDLAGNAFRTGSRTPAVIKLRSNARLYAVGCELAGHIGLYADAGPRVVLINTEAPYGQGIDATRATDPSGNGIVRAYDSASTAGVKII